MRVNKVRGSILAAVAASACVGVASDAMAQVTTAYYASSGTPYGPVSDDSQVNAQVSYTGSLLQNIQTPAEATVTHGVVEGAGDPYIIATMSYAYATSAHSGGSISTAFDTNGNGVNYFGQNSANPSPNFSAANYIDDTYLNTYPSGSTPLDFHSANLSGENSSGLAIGYQSVESADDTSSSTSGTFGRNGYLYNIAANSYVTMGLTGNNYYVNINYTATTGTSIGAYASSTPTNIDDLGDVVGTSNRYFTGNGGVSSSSAASMGTSVFYYNGSTTTEIGLFGTGYSYLKNFTASGGGSGRYSNNGQNGVNGGYAVGTATTYADLGTGSGTSYGTDAWVYSPASGTTAIGMYQSGNSVSGLPSTYNYSYPVTINSVVYNDRSSSIKALNAVGMVGGTSSYYNGSSSSTVGTDAWVYTPGAATPYTQVGFTSGNYLNSNNVRSSNITFMNKSGALTGTSVNYNGSTSTYATIAWYTPAGSSTPTVLGLTDAAHTLPTTGTGYFPTTVSELTDSGLIGGTSARYNGGTTSAGNDAWIYNTSNSAYTILEPNPSSLTGYSGYFNDSITYLAENGMATGYFQLSSGGPQFGFLYSPLGGFDDLTNDPLLATSLANNAIFSPSVPGAILNAFSIDPTGHTVYAFAATINPLTGGVNASSGVVIISVPEPASVSVLVGLAAAVGLRRRRRELAC